MLEGGKIEDIVVAPRPVHQRGEGGRGAVDREGTEIAVDIAQRAADIADEFDHVVFGDIDDMERAGVALEDLAGDGLADGAGAADDEEAGA